MFWGLVTTIALRGHPAGPPCGAADPAGHTTPLPFYGLPGCAPLFEVLKHLEKQWTAPFLPPKWVKWQKLGAKYGELRNLAVRAVPFCQHNCAPKGAFWRFLAYFGVFHCITKKGLF